MNENNIDDAAAPDSVLLTTTELARIFRRVTGANRFDETQITLMREVEHAVNQKRAAADVDISASIALRELVAIRDMTTDGISTLRQATAWSERERAAWEAARAAISTAKDCDTCGGHGLIGGHTGQTAESFSLDAEPCPDCAVPAPVAQQGAEAVRLLQVLRGFIVNICEKPLDTTAVLNLIDLATQEAQGLAAGEFVQMLKHDANAFSEMLSLMGLDEEGDPVAELSELIAGNARYVYLRTRDIESISKGGIFAGKTPDNIVLNGSDLDVAVDAGIADEVEAIAQRMFPKVPS